MADEPIHARGNQGRPAPAVGTDGSRFRPSRPDGDEVAEQTPAGGILYEGLMFLRWFLGLVIVLVCGWGFIAAIVLLTRSWKLAVPFEVAGGVAALLSLIMMVLLEKNFWLSRFMGLRIGEHSSPLAEAVILWALGVPGLLFRSTATPTPEAAAKGRAAEADSLREVVETVVFVVVLVLMLKTFVAEAFVIPTGSMATTLLGYHRNVTCPACGYTFPVNVSEQVDPPPRERNPITGCTCPNCRLRIAIDPQTGEVTPAP
jgi:hypothetical protein